MPKHHGKQPRSIREPSHGDPDEGPEMHTGPHHFDKGYVSDNEHFDPYKHDMHGQKERGNRYMSLQNEIVHRDEKKLSRGKFSKIA